MSSAYRQTESRIFHIILKALLDLINQTLPHLAGTLPWSPAVQLVPGYKPLTHALIEEEYNQRNQKERKPATGKMIKKSCQQHP